MTRLSGYLLDVNVLIALIDPSHVRHDHAHEWFASIGGQTWATCPITELGVVRIVGSSRYPNTPGSPAAVAEVLATLRSLPGHAFWQDNLSLLDAQHIRATHLSDSAQVTDTYLLALARAHEGRLATFDRHLVTNAVIGGAQALCVLG